MNDEKSAKSSISWLEPILLLSAITLIIWLGFAALAPSSQGSYRDNVRLLAHAEALQQQLQGLQAKASHYLDNAPREYEHYFRDTAISHAHLQTDIELIDTQIQALVSRRTEEPSDSAQAKDSTLTLLWQEWKGFRQELQIQLGVDPEMPRLEWGARHITEDTGPLIATLGDIRSGLDDSFRSANQGGSKKPFWAWPAFAAWIVVMLTWFGLRVRRSRA